MEKLYLKFFSLIAFSLSFYACGYKDTAGGISEETEGIYAIVDKTIEGVSQKGPFVTGSSIVLQETKKDGSLAPTGREFFATTRTNKGDFQIDNIDLESQYVRLTATGYYKREATGKNSECQINLRAISNVKDRDKVNINILTHLEYDYILYYVRNGKTFSEAKKQAQYDVLKIFGFESLTEDAEDLDINSNSEADKALEKISSFIDEKAYSCDYFIHQYTVNHRTYCRAFDEDPVEFCTNVQLFIDNFNKLYAIDESLQGHIHWKFFEE
jgi:hypothetical protein